MSIIIPTHSNFSGLKTLLHGMARQKELDGSEIEIIVVSNLLDSRVEKFCKDLETPFELKYLVSGVVGVNAARNTGMRMARGRWLYFLDDDCEFLSEDHLFHLLSEAEALLPPIVGIGGGYRIVDSSSFADITYLLTCQHWLESSRGDEGDHHLVGGNACISRKVFDEGYTFNEAIKFGGAETEFNLRLSQAGYRFKYDEKFHVKHNTKMSLSQLGVKAFKQGMGWGIREYYGVKEAGAKDLSLSQYLEAQPYSKAAKFVLRFQVFVYNLCYLSGFKYFSKEKTTNVNSWKAFGFLIQQVEKHILDRIKRSKVGQFYRAGLEARNQL
tara:strand:- start:30097 stop:31077 length:981 start_codon:yes stop_codon:yes gene_type:complete